MKRVFLIIFVYALMIDVVSAHARSDKPSSVKPQEVTTTSADLSPELREAERLNAEVVKLYKAGKFDEAAPLAKRVLQIREKALAPGHDLIVSALINLGEVYRARRKYKEAEIYYQRLLAGYEQASPQDFAAMSNVIDVLAYLSYMQFNFDDTEKLYQRALSLREQAAGQENLEVATSAFNLAEFYRLRGNYKKAEPLYQRAIEIKGSALGPDDKDVVKVLERYSCLYYAMNQREKFKEIRSQFSFLSQKDDAIVDQGEILNDRALSLPTPEYPQIARGIRISGIVVIKVMINEAGKVTGAEDMCAAHPFLTDAAIRAAYQARFTPKILSGVPVKMTGVITYKFIAR